jgi:hypothetical protein
MLSHSIYLFMSLSRKIFMCNLFLLIVAQYRDVRSLTKSTLVARYRHNLRLRQQLCNHSISLGRKRILIQLRAPPLSLFYHLRLGMRSSNTLTFNHEDELLFELQPEDYLNYRWRLRNELN